ncbi:MAG: DMT family transporter [Ruminococcus sp.]|nr:DMT family transporter [Candidatus Copronaster equi]
MKIVGPLILVSAAMIWGLSFVAQSDGMKYIGGFTFNAVRSLLGALCLIRIIIFRAKKDPETIKCFTDKKKRKRTAVGILLVGTMLCIGLNLQQFAFAETAPGKVGFITALYMLLVPVFSIFLKKKTPFTVWIGVAIALVGLYLLCIGPNGSFGSVGRCDFLAFLGAFAFAFHILLVDKFVKDIDCTILSCGQFVVSAILSAICMVIFEEPEITGILKTSIPLLYTGICSCGIAFTFQLIGQKYTEPTIASMLLCLESVFSVVFSFLILHTQMSIWEYIGCAIMFVGIILAQIRPKSAA